MMSVSDPRNRGHGTEDDCDECHQAQSQNCRVCDVDLLEVIDNLEHKPSDS